jgi:hypothetical protein
MGARNRVRIGLSYQPARLHRLAELTPWNRFLGSLNFKNSGSVFPQDERDTLTSGLGDSELIDSRLDSLSQQIVEKLIDKISSKGEY